MARARAVLDGARRIAAHTPAQLEAARTTEQQATAPAPYRAGLGGIVDVAEAQRQRTQARKIDDALARLAVWRASWPRRCVGDLSPFLQLAR